MCLQVHFHLFTFITTTQTTQFINSSIIDETNWNYSDFWKLFSVTDYIRTYVFIDFRTHIMLLEIKRNIIIHLAI